MEEGGQEVTPPKEGPTDLLGYGMYVCRWARRWEEGKSCGEAAILDYKLQI